MVKKDIFPQIVVCGHCLNETIMIEIGSVSKKIEYSGDMPEEYLPEVYDVYTVLKCPTCKEINVFTYFWNENWDAEEDVKLDILYPQNVDYPLGMPENIKEAYNSAEKARFIGANAYAILVRRMLEMVCLDKKAEGKDLANMLSYLAQKGDIPDKLVKVASGLRNFGNIGAHAASGNLTEKEIPILKALARAILEYLYSAPYLANQAELRLNQIKSTHK